MFLEVVVVARRVVGTPDVVVVRLPPALIPFGLEIRRLLVVAERLVFIVAFERAVVLALRRADVAVVRPVVVFLRP